MAAVLYGLSLLFEVGSIASRWLISVMLLSIFMPIEQASLYALIIALLPIAISLLTLTGIPSGFLFSRPELGGRKPSQRELAAIKSSLALLARPGVKMPSHIFATDHPEENAFVRGTTLYVTHMLTESDYLTAVLAHELGHLNTADGRILVALDRFLIPLGPNIAGFLNKVLVIILKVFYWTVATICGPFFSVFYSRNSGEAKVGRFVRGILLEWLPSWIIILSVGGTGMKFMARPWQWYFRKREYTADAYTAKLGQGSSLIEFLELHQGASLPDIMLPHAEAPTHPPTELRIDKLLAKIAELSAVEQQETDHASLPENPTALPERTKPVQIPLLNQSSPTPAPLQVNAGVPSNGVNTAAQTSLREALPSYQVQERVNVPLGSNAEKMLQKINALQAQVLKATPAERQVIAQKMGIPEAALEQKLAAWKTSILRTADSVAVQIETDSAP